MKPTPRSAVPSPLPSVSQCYGLFDQHRSPARLVRHCLRVNQVAVFLADALSLKGARIHMELVDLGSLLHSLNHHRETPTAHHAELTARELAEFPELAEVIRRHPVESILDPERRPTSIEQKIVYYADRRVMDDEIVPLETKLYRTLAKELLRGLGSRAPALLVPLVRLEQELFAPLDFAPMDLQQLQDARLNHDARHLLPATV